MHEIDYSEKKLAENLVDWLIECLNRSGIAYCHWKSNYSLQKAMSGELDLDLLVDRNSIAQVFSILYSLGFKSAVQNDEPETPGIYHLYGVDSCTGELIHVHLFGRLLTGESFVKSHLLPFSKMLLENTAAIGDIKVPAHSAELVLFIVRTFIKYGSLLDLLYLSRSSDEVEAEFRWLQDGSEMTHVLYLLETYCPEIDETLFIECLNALNSSASLLQRVRVARQVRLRLRAYAIRRGLERMAAYGRLLWREGWNRLLRSGRNRVLASGGAVVAFVGAEATGKSTLVSDCERWLGDVFAVRSIHAGKPPSTWLTLPYNLLLPLARRLLPSLRTTRIETSKTSIASTGSKAASGRVSSLALALGAVVLAWDRRQLLIKARRLAAKGELIICDRYPSDIVGAMDSPRLKELLTSSGVLGAIYNRLLEIERRLYKQIPAPEIVLSLEVSVETALERNRQRIKNGKEGDAYVASRHRQFKRWHKPGTKHIYHLDTSQPLEQTVLEMRKTIWEML